MMGCISRRGQRSHAYLRAAFPLECVSSDENETLTPGCGFFTHLCVSFGVACLRWRGLLVFCVQIESEIMFALSAAVLDQYCTFPTTIRIRMSDTTVIKGTVHPECNFCYYILTLTVFCPKITKMHHKYTMEVVHMMNALNAYSDFV